MEIAFDGQGCVYQACHFRISEEPIEESEEISEGLIVDYNTDRCLVGIEIINVKEKCTMEDLTDFKLEMPPFQKAVEA
ncbi:MAG: DUF2283 domain-containing protein [ANME-2 cluster archaeon]|nr:DUF2283 domain-containing protein [ANME-2 cluster archaeon]